jgi:hypothetical protein
MNLKRFLVAGLAGGVVGNVYDYVLHEKLLASQYAAVPTLFRSDAPILWLVVGDFVAAFVLVWVWDRVMACFPPGGAKSGALGGLYAGVLINFPSAIFWHLLFVGFPYSMSWIWTVAGIVWCVLVGAVIGALYKK